jgi:sarcosine oxidase/L-pipecolate oxidase
MTTPEPRTLILGAGTFGTSLAAHLSKHYQDPSLITLLDRWDPNDDDKNAPAPADNNADDVNDVNDKDDVGAPHLHAHAHAAAVDINRIIRTDYASPLYASLAREAAHFWFWGVAVQGHFHKTGWVVLEEGGEEGEGFGASVQRVKGSGQYAAKGSTIDAAAVVEKNAVLAGVDASRFSGAYANAEAGWVDSARATAAYLRTAQSRGVQRATGDVVEVLLHPQHRGVRGVRTRDGRVFEAERVVIAAGAWTSSLLSPVEDALCIREADRVERQLTAVGRVSAYYTLSARETADMVAAEDPVVVLGGAVDVIPPYYDNRTLKINDLRTEFMNSVTTASRAKITAPSTRRQRDVPRNLRVHSERVIRAALPQWTEARKPAGWRICWDAVTPTEDWLMCRHPDARLANLFIAAGGSFHSYK